MRWRRSFPAGSSVIHRTGARGLGRSLVAGLQRALETDADLIFQMDADFSHDPKYLPDMAAAAADADLVLGSRYLHGVSVVNWPLHRIVLSSVRQPLYPRGHRHRGHATARRGFDAGGARRSPGFRSKGSFPTATHFSWSSCTSRGASAAACAKCRSSSWSVARARRRSRPERTVGVGHRAVAIAPEALVY